MRRRPGELTLSVVNDPATSAGTATATQGPAGNGPTGMRERVALLDGTITAGPLTEGGFAVRVHLPVPEQEPVGR